MREKPYQPPVTALENAFQDAVEDPLFDPLNPLSRYWWTLFQDAQLSWLIETAIVRNPTLQIAQASTLKACIIAERTRSSLFPHLFWGADVSRQKFSETGIIPFNLNSQPGHTPFPAQGGVNGIPVYFTQYETELTLTYDFDIWGKNRNAWRSALSDVQASLADEIFTRLQLSIEVAKVYYQLQTDYKRKKIAQALIENKARNLDAVTQRLHANLENVLSLNVAETQLLESKQLLLQIEADIVVKECQLRAFIAGDFEEEIFDISMDACALPKMPLPLDVPVHLISRRPDITAQLWLIYSAGRHIEVAKAGFYPDFNITALFGYQTLHFSKLFRHPSTFYNIDPAVTLPIFDGGRLRAELRGSCIDYDIEILKYNDLVINAAKEVLEGLAILKNADCQLQEFAKTREIQNTLYQLTQLREAHNLNSIQDTLSSQGNLLKAEDLEILALGNTYQAMLSLIKALGGGYHE